MSRFSDDSWGVGKKILAALGQASDPYGARCNCGNRAEFRPKHVHGFSFRASGTVRKRQAPLTAARIKKRNV